MPDSFIQIPPDSTGKKLDTVAFDRGAGDLQQQRVVPVDSNSGADIVQPITDAQLRAAPVDVNAGDAAPNALTDAQLRATPVDVNAGDAAPNALTDAQLRAGPIDVNSATPLDVQGDTNPNGLTDAQLRATAVPVVIPPTGSPAEIYGSEFDYATTRAIIPTPPGGKNQRLWSISITNKGATPAQPEFQIASVTFAQFLTIAPGATVTVTLPVPLVIPAGATLYGFANNAGESFSSFTVYDYV